MRQEKKKKGPFLRKALMPYGDPWHAQRTKGCALENKENNQEKTQSICVYQKKCVILQTFCAVGQTAMRKMVAELRKMAIA